MFYVKEKINDVMEVSIEINDENGKISLSRKVLLPKPKRTEKNNDHFTEHQKEKSQYSEDETKEI